MTLRAALIAACVATPALAQDQTAILPITSVTLSSGGLAEVTRGAEIGPGETLRLDVPLSQADDVLKSLVVADPAGGVAAVTLDGRVPLESALRDYPFTQADMASAADLMAANQGERVTIADGNSRKVTGTIVGVADAPGPRAAGDGKALARPVASIMDDGGTVVAIEIGPETSVTFLDEAVRQRLAQAAAAVRAAKATGTRTVEIRLPGEGSRKVGLSYVVAAPVWKTSYRAVIGEGETARLQAWAVVENATGADWKGVDLTLATGAPVALKQRLLDSIWVDRPEVAVTADRTAAPETDTGARKRQNFAGGSPRAARAVGAFDAEPEAAEAAPAPMIASLAAGMAGPEETAAAAEGAASTAYRVPTKVDLPAGKTLAMPFVDAKVPAERISVFRPGRGSRNPVAAVLMKNDTGATLPGGLVTFYDSASGYVGDAAIAPFPAGEDRLASFAADRKVTVDSDQDIEQRTVSIKVVDGMARVSIAHRQVTTYTVKGAADGERIIVIEHPLVQGWTVTSDDEDARTGTHVRLKRKVAAGATVTLVAIAERTESNGWVVGEATVNTLIGWRNSAPDAATAAKFGELVEAKRAQTDAQTRVKDAEQDIERLASEQERVRENLKAVPAQGDAARRYLAALDKLETDIAAATTRRDDATKALREAERLLTERIRTF